MRDGEFAAYMAERNLAERTRMQRAYALKRIERAYAVDLDEEFARDGLASISRSLSYSSSDARLGAPNPSPLDIEPEKLLTHLRWYKSHVADYIRFKGGTGDTLDPIAPADTDNALSEEIIDEAVGRTFALERDLQASLRANIGQLESGMTVADGGFERKVAAGFIDILARDRHGCLTVIELKAEATRPEAVAQVLAYMGCVAEETQEPVRGILVAADHHPRVEHAAKAVPNLQLKRYRFRFEFA